MFREDPQYFSADFANAQAVTSEDIKNDSEYHKAVSMFGKAKISIEGLHIKYNVKVRDHCHLTGQFIGAAHNQCNLGRKEVVKIPLFCHNFSGYDSHLIVSSLKHDDRIKKLEALPKNTEKFRTINLNFFSFVDSISFLDGSLADLVNDLVNSNHPFNLLQTENMCKNNDEKSLLLRKGVFPYEYATSVDQLRKKTTMPKKEKFFSKISNSSITDEDYQHACKVFETFECKNMLEYAE
jgi:hypothetical protein